MVTTVAGTLGEPGFVDGSGSAARFASPAGVAMGSDGAVYIADYMNSAVRRLTASGDVTTEAANDPFDIGGPRGIALSPNGDIYIVGDIALYRIAGGRKSLVTLFPPAIDAIGVAVDATGNVFIAASPLRSSFATGQILRLSGTDWLVVAGAGTPGLLDGPASIARFRQVSGLTLDSAGSLFVADLENGAVRKLSNGVVSTLPGTVTSRGFKDGAGADARFAWPWAIAHGPDGSLYVSDFYNNAVRKVTKSGQVSTGPNQGPDVPIQFACALNPMGVAFVGTDLWVLANNGNNYSGAGMTNICVLPTGPTQGSGGGTVLDHGVVARNLAVGPDGSIYIAIGIRIYKWPAVGSASSPFAGTFPSTGQVVFYDPEGMAVDSSGNLFVADPVAGVIFKVTPQGVVSIFAGSLGFDGHVDGTGTAAVFFRPYRLAIDEQDNLYVVHKGPIRKITPDAVVSTVALEWGTPVLHGIAVSGGVVYGVTSDAVIQARLPR